MSVSAVNDWPVLTPIKSGFGLNCVQLLYVFGKSGDEVILVTNEDSVYALGANRDGVLGLGHKNAVKEPTLVRQLCAKQITSIQSNSNILAYNYVLALTKSGQLYSWGENEFACLANGSRDDCYKPKLVNALNGMNVVDVCCGLAHCLALTQSGEVFAWGDNSDGRVGYANDNTIQMTVTKIMALNIMRISSIACGGYHSMAVTESGVVYVWGRNDCGQLGVGHRLSQNIAVKVNLKQTFVKKVCAGYCHSLLLTSNGEVYAFGDNEFGQIGDASRDNKLKPIKLSIAKIVDIYATHSSNISIALSEEKQCFVWGINEYVRPTEVVYKTINDAFNCYSNILVTLKPLSFTRDIYKRHSNTFDVEKYSDLRFKVEGKYIYVQKSYLKGVCSHFDDMFANDWLERDAQEIEITQYSYSVYYSLLKYLYTNEVQIKVEEAMDLYDLANSYFEETLKNECKRIIRIQLSVDNVCQLYASALKYDSQEMQDFCVDFAFDKMQDIIKSEGFKGLDLNTSNTLFKRLFFSNDFQMIKKFKK